MLIVKVKKYSSSSYQIVYISVKLTDMHTRKYARTHAQCLHINFRDFKLRIHQNILVYKFSLGLNFAKFTNFS